MGRSNNRSIRLSRAQRVLVAVVVLGATVIAAIGFAGSYTAVRELAARKGFGSFSVYFPLGVDAGIAVLLSLDLLLTHLRIPLPMLRQVAWLLTLATISFNAAAASDAIGVAMHATIPVLFVVAVEAARHAIGRLAAITEDQHMDGIRVSRWVLAPLPTFLLWRKMRLWELRRYSDAISDEQDRLVHQARLRAKYGWQWRRRAPLDALLPLRLARLGVPLRTSAGAGSATEPPPPVPAPLPPESGTSPCGEEVREPATSTSDASSSTDADESAAKPLPLQGGPAGTADGTAKAGTPSSAPALRTGVRTVPQRRRAPKQLAGGHTATVPAPVAQVHRDAVEGARTNADAIRYALATNAGADDSAVVTWLAELGRTVNRGQVYRVKQQAERKRQRSSSVTASE
ncbi:DUF2637 domain-containing protein [Streptomyces sp. NPDC015125]|uniref:DUF2637 domain-containing protein n=1 Tax=Streptomyces sp. NPDC015125 TaxID=3364938 RepID=UPI0036FB99EA